MKSVALSSFISLAMISQEFDSTMPLIRRHAASPIRHLKLFLLILSLSFFLPLTGSARTQNSETPLTNASVIKLVRAGFRERTIIAIIRTRPTQFDLSPDRLIELKRSGVSEQIILAMIARDDQSLMGDDFDDSVFDDASGLPRRRTNGGDGGTNIFGSSGGSSSRTSGRTNGGSTSGNSQTTGSATVHIVRPPVEQGGAPHLERTPTLTNDSIVELVEAGFSEGTIIRRIEQSPVEFDLSSKKLDELRRHRVSDRIIAAMTSAMSDDTSTHTPTANPSPQR